MKLLIAAVLLSFAGAGLAQQGHGSHRMDEPAKKTQAAEQTHRAAGVVKSVNADKGTVTIAHEPVESLKWPAMTMAFKPKDRTLLGNLKPGQKVEFNFVKQGHDYVIIATR